MPAANGSSTSRTSVRARCRISVANRSSEMATSASAESSSACRSRAITCVESGIRLEPEPLAGDPLDLGLDCRVRADRAGELADAFVSSALEHARPVAVELERPAGELPAEGRRLRVDPVRAADADRVPVLLRPATTASKRALEAGEDEPFPASWICSASAVSTTSDEVEAVVEPASLRPELLASRRRRTRPCRGRSSARSRRRAPGVGAHRRARIAATSLGGIAPTSAQPSSAASSTSSQCASLRSSDQILAIAGRE